MTRLTKALGARLGSSPKKTSRAYKEAYRTKRGRMLIGRIENVLDSRAGAPLRGKVNLIFTSPPFPLVRKKRYGNESGQTYVRWLEKLAPRLRELLSPNGSIVIELGNAWVRGSPI